MGGPTPKAAVGTSGSCSQQCRPIGEASWCQSGLVDGLQDISTERFYSRSMDLRRAAEMVSRRDFILKAGLRDAGGDSMKLKEDFGHILGNARALFAQKLVWNHEELQGVLGDIVQQQGEFVCLLGGKSTGKSQMLRDLINSNKSEDPKVPKVFMLNMREHGAISTGLLRGLTDLGAKRISRMLPPLAGVIEGLAPLLSHFMQAIGYKVPGVAEAHALALSKSRVANRSKDVQILRVLLDAMIKELGPVIIVIDEANLTFDLEPAGNETGVHPTREVLELFTTFTKEQQQANIILVSSDHSFPFGLKRVMFNLANFTRFMYAGELSPKDMLRLLQEKWGVGRHLAVALLAHYGGHVWETYQALNQLRGHPAFFVGVDPLKWSSVRKCLAWQPSMQQQEQAAAERGRMRDTLRLLAERGFAPIPMEEDPVAGVLSQHDVGGIIKAGSLVVGLQPEAWGDAKFGMVPTTQSMRLAIAVVLMSVEDSRTTEVPVLTP